MKDQGHGSHGETVFDDEFAKFWEENEKTRCDKIDIDCFLLQAWESFRRRISDKDVLDRDLCCQELSDILKEKVVEKKKFSYITVCPINSMQKKIIVCEVRDGSGIIYNRAILFQLIKDKNELKGIYNDLQYLEELLLKDKYDDCEYFAVANLGQSDKIFGYIYDIDVNDKDYYYGAFNIVIGTDRFADSGHNNRTDKKCQNNSIDVDVRIPKCLLKKLTCDSEFWDNVKF